MKRIVEDINKATGSICYRVETSFLGFLWFTDTIYYIDSMGNDMLLSAVFDTYREACNHVGL